jgi:hypothetical protein
MNILHRFHMTFYHILLFSPNSKTRPRGEVNIYNHQQYLCYCKIPYKQVSDAISKTTQTDNFEQMG